MLKSGQSLPEIHQAMRQHIAKSRSDSEIYSRSLVKDLLAGGFSVPEEVLKATL